MEILTIGIDLGRRCFTWLSIHPGTWSSENGARAANC
jgi:hypothetical protein